MFLTYRDIKQFNMTEEGENFFLKIVIEKTIFDEIDYVGSYKTLKTIVLFEPNEYYTIYNNIQLCFYNKPAQTIGFRFHMNDKCFSKDFNRTRTAFYGAKLKNLLCNS